MSRSLRPRQGPLNRPKIARGASGKGRGPAAALSPILNTAGRLIALDALARDVCVCSPSCRAAGSRARFCGPVTPPSPIPHPIPACTPESAPTGRHCAPGRLLRPGLTAPALRPRSRPLTRGRRRRRAGAVVRPDIDDEERANGMVKPRGELNAGDDEGTVWVRRGWFDHLQALYRLGSISGPHWAVFSGGTQAPLPQPCLAGYVSCDGMIAGELAHSGTHGPCPHRIKVLVFKKGNAPAAYAKLAEAAGPRPPRRHKLPPQRCAGETREGNRCRRWATPGQQYCPAH